MYNEPTTATVPSRGHELHALRNEWWTFLALGVALIVFGTIAIGSAVMTTVAVTVLFGFLLLAGGITQIVSAFWTGRWSGMLLHLLIGVLYTIVGLMTIDDPFESAAALTLLIALVLIFSGVFRIVTALADRFTGWGWVLLSGGVSLLLGLMIYRQWPATGAWAIGLFVGIEMIFNGWVWVMLALGLRRLRDNAS
jgi:uncharacterized membrane protein HdeD (DUF308 family)